MGVKVLIVDDDEITGGLSRDLLVDAGFDAELLTSSLDAVELIKEKGYDLVVLDILMPGLNGLTLCHRIKKDPQIKHTKVVMVSGKTFASDKKLALEYGASLFIEKPYNVETFVHQIREVLNRAASREQAQAPRAESLSAINGQLQIDVWGCRSAGGSAAPSSYGRKTSCVSVDTGDQLLVFDAGSGIADLGQRVSADARRREAWLFLTHFHADHVEGLPSFAPAAKKGFTLHVSGSPDPDKTLEQLVQAAFQSGPATIPSVEAQIELYEMLEDVYNVMPGVKITSFYANHPGTTLGYVLETKGRKIVYCPDSEIYGEATTALQDYDEKLGRLCRGADLLIHDGRYTANDYRTLRNHGHSAAESVVDLAGRYDIKRLLLFHHDADYTDETLDQIAASVATQAADKAYAVQVALAREGLKLSI